MHMIDLIEKKKHKESLTNEEIKFFVKGLLDQTIPDYQTSALLMAIIFNDLTEEEIYFLTKAMVESGEMIDLSHISGICVDKHSTGGVGDTTTLMVAPILASLGLKLAKMSGRGLGHTGGTLDKLESIPGFSINLTSKEFNNQVEKIGLAVVGQTKDIAPADKKLYALRDVTGTVDNSGLIASSIMSKKLASGAEYILLDVKVGSGAFMKTLDDARVLASKMVKIGSAFGKKTVALLTNMDAPLGEYVGNSLEVMEAIEVLKGRGASDLKLLVYELVVELLLMTGKYPNRDLALIAVDDAIKSGKALEKLREMIMYQKGNPEVIDDYKLFPNFKETVEVKSLLEGYVNEIDTTSIGVAAMNLGAGRETKDDKIDLGVGLRIIKKPGDYVSKGETLAFLYVNEKGKKEAYQKVMDAYTITKSKPKIKPMVYEIVR